MTHICYTNSWFLKRIKWCKKLPKIHAKLLYDVRAPLTLFFCGVIFIPPVALQVFSLRFSVCSSSKSSSSVVKPKRRIISSRFGWVSEAVVYVVTVMYTYIYVYVLFYATTQLVLRLHQELERTKVVCSNREAGPRALPLWTRTLGLNFLR